MALFDDDNDFFIDNVEDDAAGADSDREPAHEEPQRSPRGARPWKLVALILGAVLGIIAYLRYGTPYVEDANITGHALFMQSEGLIFKTYEGEFISEESLSDPTRLYQRGFTFSVTDAEVAKTIDAAIAGHTPLRLTYKRYYGMLPWRGSSTTIITAAQPLPPRSRGH